MQSSTNSMMDRFRTVGLSLFQFWLILEICKDALTSRHEVRFTQTFFQNEVKKVLYKMAMGLVSDFLENIRRIKSPLNLKNMKFKNSNFCPEYRTG